jgi:hypothetical protein
MLLLECPERIRRLVLAAAGGLREAMGGAAVRVPAGCSRAHSRAACATHQLARPDQEVRSSMAPAGILSRGRTSSRGRPRHGSKAPRGPEPTKEPIKTCRDGSGGIEQLVVRLPSVVAGSSRSQTYRQAPWPRRMRVGAVCFRSICPRRICARCLGSGPSGRPLRPASDLAALAELREHTRRHAEKMASGQCPMMSMHHGAGAAPAKLDEHQGHRHQGGN